MNIHIDHIPSPRIAGSAEGDEPGILLVDDDPMLVIQAHLLRSMGYRRVGVASSARATLKLLSEDPKAVAMWLSAT